MFTHPAIRVLPRLLFATRWRCHNRSSHNPDFNDQVAFFTQSCTSNILPCRGLPLRPACRGRKKGRRITNPPAAAQAERLISMSPLSAVSRTSDPIATKTNKNMTLKKKRSRHLCTPLPLACLSIGTLGIGQPANRVRQPGAMPLPALTSATPPADGLPRTTCTHTHRPHAHLFSHHSTG